MHLLVVDDNSPDGTGRWCAQQQARHPWFQCLIRERQRGLGTATVAGLLIGSRYVPGGQLVGDRIRGAVARRCTNWPARKVLRLACRDHASALRVYRADALRNVDLKSVDAQRNGYLQQLLVAIDRTGWRIEEWPIAFGPRKSGKSKKKTWREGLGVWRELLRLALARRNRREPRFVA